VSDSSHTRPPGSGPRQGESEEGGAELPSLAPWEPLESLPVPGEVPLTVLSAFVQEARAATSEAERSSLAERINHQLDTLEVGGEGRRVADLLHQFLEGGQLAGLEDASGRTCRAAATEALLRLGFPFALEVRPEDLEHLRARDPSAPSRFPWAPWGAAGALGAGTVTEWLLTQSASPPLSPSEEPLLPLVLLMGLSLLSLVPALLGPERSDARRAGLLVLLVLALVQLFLGVFGGYYGTFSGGAALLAWLLLVLPRR